MTQSVDRALTLLLDLAAQAEEGDGRTQLRDLCRRTGINKATAHRLLATLVSKGFVYQQPEDSSYQLGATSIKVGQAAFHARGYLRRLLPVVQELAALTGETVSIGERHGMECVTVYEIESSQPVRYANKIGVTVPLHVSAGARVVLAYTPVQQLEGYLSQRLEPVTDRTITDPVELRANLEQVRAAGYAHSHGEFVPGVHSIAVPFFDRTGTSAAGSVSILWPARDEEIDQQRLETWPQLLLDTMHAWDGMDRKAKQPT